MTKTPPHTHKHTNNLPETTGLSCTWIFILWWRTSCNCCPANADLEKCINIEKHLNTFKYLGAPTDTPCKKTAVYAENIFCSPFSMRVCFVWWAFSVSSTSSFVLRSVFFELRSVFFFSGFILVSSVHTCVFDKSCGFSMDHSLDMTKIVWSPWMDSQEQRSHELKN